MELAGFTIHREIGRGAASVVYLATWEAVGREVALKVPADEAARNPSVRQRFSREYDLLAPVDHPNIVKVYEAGTGDFPYIAMEYLDGGDLIARLGRGMSASDAVRVAKQVALALDALRGHGIAHRDVKPEHILFRGRDEAVLTDFGIAAKAGAATSPDMIVGTSRYMSPEQAAGGAADGRSDLYSLGVVFHLMLTGEVSSASDERGFGLLPERVAMFQDAVDRWLLRDPERRFQTGAEVIRALDAADVQEGFGTTLHADTPGAHRARCLPTRFAPWRARRSRRGRMSAWKGPRAPRRRAASVVVRLR